jgi:hypothetical protein
MFYFVQLIFKKMNKYLAYFLILTCCSGCSVVSKQYYYVPTAAHETTKEIVGGTKMIYNKVELTDSAGKHIGSMSTSNGIGIPLLMGPPYVPVVPVGVVWAFSKKLRQFQMDVTIRPDEGYFMTLAVDSNSYKILRDSLTAKKVGTGAYLHTTGCYLIVNGSTKVPLRVRENFMQQTNAHDYRFSAPIGFGRVLTLSIVTGNPLLDARLKNLVFKRKKRLTYFLLGLS